LIDAEGNLSCNGIKLCNPWDPGGNDVSGRVIESTKCFNNLVCRPFSEVSQVKNIEVNTSKNSRLVLKEFSDETEERINAEEEVNRSP
jgi:hypothetical protein